MDWLTDPQILMALLALTALEIVLGIDNVIFIAILAGRLPEHQQQRGRTMGLGLAMITRILLLFSITLIMELTAPLFTIFGSQISGRDIILILALSFLLLVGISLVGEGLEMHIPKGYIYFAMAFSIFVESLNLRVRKHRAPVHLRRGKRTATFADTK